MEKREIPRVLLRKMIRMKMINEGVNLTNCAGEKVKRGPRREMGSQRGGLSVSRAMGIRSRGHKRKPNFCFPTRITTASRQCALNLERPSN